MAERTIAVGASLSSSDQRVGPGLADSSVKNVFIEQISRVIFPDNKWIKIWDNLVLLLLFGLAFIIPYQVGVSGGVYLITTMWWLIFNILINGVFWVDTFLYFWRAYRRTSDGRLIFNLRSIRRHYLRTMFVPNLLGNLPTTLIFYFLVQRLYGSNHKEICVDESYNTYIIMIKMVDILKLIRFCRLKTIVQASDAVTDLTERHNSQFLELIKYTFLIVLVSHWFACVWSCVAYIESGSFCAEAMLSNPNWIGNWFRTTYGEEGVTNGGLNPIGWLHDLDRYVLSLFWAVQTITSIGYGNIAPFTHPEWWIACILMLSAGVMWAYVIGGLVGVAAAMQVSNELYRTRIDGANAMIGEFGFIEQNSDQRSDQLGGHDPDVYDSNTVARRIKKYIHYQNQVSRNAAYACDLNQAFPVLESLTPELRRLSSLLIVAGCLDKVRYLSSTYLTAEEQSYVATECTLLDFAAGEIVKLDEPVCVGSFGRGIYVLKRGSAYTWRNLPGHGPVNTVLLTAGMAFGDDKVLTEEGCKASKGALRFLTFGTVIFIPRRAVLAALDRNTRAWKDCGRWMYLRAHLRDQGAKEDRDTT